MNLEILLTGSFGVGKSSLFNRYIYDEFTNNYNGTIGVRTGVKEIQLSDHGSDHDIAINLWDITGEIAQVNVPVVYYHKKDVIIYVIDLSRPFTFENIQEDIVYIKETAPNAMVKIIGNKKDVLLPKELQEARAALGHIFLDQVISAKTNENVDTFFEELAMAQLVQQKSNI